MDEERGYDAVEEASYLLPPGYVWWPGHDEGTFRGPTRGEGCQAPIAGQAGFPSVFPRSGEWILGTEFSGAFAVSTSSFAGNDRTACAGDVIAYNGREGGRPGGGSVA